MSVRKIRLTLSSTIKNSIGALIDVDFNNENLDVDLDIAAEYGVATLVKEYTVDVAAGTYNLDISYKNDAADDTNSDGNFDSDRNLIIEKIEIANNGVDYEPLVVATTNSNLELHKHYSPMGFFEKPDTSYNPDQPRSETNWPYLKNPGFNAALAQTDANDYPGYIYGNHPGNNPLFVYNDVVINPVTLYTSGTATFQLSFL